MTVIFKGHAASLSFSVLLDGAQVALSGAEPGPWAILIGPEGGFIPYEVEALQRAGCEPVSLGPRPLRVEQAVPALLGRLL